MGIAFIRAASLSPLDLKRMEEFGEIVFACIMLLLCQFSTLETKEGKYACHILFYIARYFLIFTKDPLTLAAVEYDSLREIWGRCCLVSYQGGVFKIASEMCLSEVLVYVLPSDGDRNRKGHGKKGGSVSCVLVHLVEVTPFSILRAF